MYKHCYVCVLFGSLIQPVCQDDAAGGSVKRRLNGIKDAQRRPGPGQSLVKRIKLPLAGSTPRTPLSACMDIASTDFNSKW